MILELVKSRFLGLPTLETVYTVLRSTVEGIYGMVKRASDAVMVGGVALLGAALLQWHAITVLAWACACAAAFLSLCGVASCVRFRAATAKQRSVNRGTQLKRQQWPGRVEFGALHVRPCEPALFANFMLRPDCAALRRWSPELFATVGSGEEKGLVCGRGNVEERSGPTVKLEVKVRRLLAAWRRSESGDGKECRFARDGERAAADCEASDTDGVLAGAYLKQFDVFDAFPELWWDADPLRRAFPGRMVGQTFLWMGRPGQSVTGVHNDDEHNLLCQVAGRKRVLLWPPTARSALRPNAKYDSGTECCDADPLQPSDTCPPPIEALLEPGDVLFIPIYWYHHVQSVPERPRAAARTCASAPESGEPPSTRSSTPDDDDSVNISLNHFASAPLEAATVGLWRDALERLHHAGLYRTAPCVCHSQTEPPALRRAVGCC